MGIFGIILERFLSISIPCFGAAAIILAYFVRPHWRPFAWVAGLLALQLVTVTYFAYLGSTNPGSFDWLGAQWSQLPVMAGWLSLIISGGLAAYIYYTSPAKNHHITEHHR